MRAPISKLAAVVFSLSIVAVAGEARAVENAGQPRAIRSRPSLRIRPASHDRHGSWVQRGTLRLPGFLEAGRNAYLTYKIIAPGPIRPGDRPIVIVGGLSLDTTRHYARLITALARRTGRPIIAVTPFHTGSSFVQNDQAGAFAQGTSIEIATQARGLNLLIDRLVGPGTPVDLFGDSMGAAISLAAAAERASKGQRVPRLVTHGMYRGPQHIAVISRAWGGAEKLWDLIGGNLPTRYADARADVGVRERRLKAARLAAGEGDPFAAEEVIGRLSSETRLVDLRGQDDTFLKPASELLAKSDQAVRARASSGSTVIPIAGGGHYDAVAKGDEFGIQHLVPLFVSNADVNAGSK